MSSNKRLQELQKQKELVQSHLQWLESEIAKEETTPEVPGTDETPSEIPVNRIKEQDPTPQHLPESRLDNDSPDDLEPPQEQAVEDIYTELGPNTKSAASQTKSGCLIAFAVAMALLAAGVGAIYYFY